MTLWSIYTGNEIEQVNSSKNKATNQPQKVNMKGDSVYVKKPSPMVLIIRAGTSDILHRRGTSTHLITSWGYEKLQVGTIFSRSGI